MEEIIQTCLLGNVHMDDIENAILHEILCPRSQGIRKSEKFGRLILEELSDDDAFALFRFKKEDLPILANGLGIPAEIEVNGYHVTGIEALCMYLRRMAYPNRLCDLERLFGLSAPYLSTVINKTTSIIMEKNGRLLASLAANKWLNRNKLLFYSEAVLSKGSPLANCWGFIDGTARAICRPSQNQENYYSGHKRQHCLKYQSVLCPDGIIVNLSNAFPGRRHDAGILRESNFYEQLERSCRFENEKFVIYGDPAYPIRELLLCPYSNPVTEGQKMFNTRMSKVRMAVEWGFGKVIRDFAFLDFKKNQKLLLQNLNLMYASAVILAYCHTCLYGNQTASYFKIQPPSLAEYLDL